MNTKKESGGKNGMEDSDLVTSQLNYIRNNVLKALFKHPNSWPFHTPVDVVKLDLPDYFTIIKKPMDMGTIMKKIDSHQYASSQECIDDFKLMCENCYVYNGPKDEVVLMCKEIEDIFDKKIERMPMELKNVKRGRGRAPASVPAAMSTSNGSISDNLSPNTQPTKPKIISDNSSVPTNTSLVTSAVNHTRPVSASISTPVVVTAINTVTNCSTVPIETYSPVVGNALAPSSKTKKSVKRKAEDASSPACAGLSDASYQPSVPGASASANERRESTGRAIKRPKKEIAEEKVQQHSINANCKLHTEALTYCHSIVLQLYQNPLASSASYFFNCIDRTTPGMENYYDIIKRPMDLSTVKKNLENNVYQKSSEFAMDMRQIFTNSYRYFPADTKIVKAAKTVQDFFELNYAKAPDDPQEVMPAAAANDSTFCDPMRGRHKRSNSKGSSSYSSGDDNDSDEEEREEKLRLLQDQLLQVQQEVLKLSQNIEKDKKRKSKNKRSEKPPELKPPDVVLNVLEQPVPVAEPVLEPPPKPRTKPSKPVRTKLPSQKKVPQKNVAKTEKTAANIPESVLPPPPLPPASPPHLSRDEQNQLREEIVKLPEDAHISILHIIHSRETALDVKGEEVEIDFETLKPSTIMEIKAFVQRFSQEIAEKKPEPERPSEHVVDILVDDDLKAKKIETLDDSPVHPIVHALPQQPMRPSTTAAPKPHPRMLSTTTSSSYGHQVRQMAPEPVPTITPPPPLELSRAPTLPIPEKSKSPQITLQEPLYTKYSGFVEQKSLSLPTPPLPPPTPPIIVAPAVERRPDETVISSRPSAAVPPASMKPALVIDTAHSPSPSVMAPKKPVMKSLGNNNEDSSSPKPNAKPMGGLTSSSSSASLKSGSAAVGPFGIDVSKVSTQREAVPKPSATGWSFANLAASSQPSAIPKSASQQTLDNQFNRFKRIAHERKERERANQEKELMRQQRVKLEEEERERRRREQQKAREEEEALAKMLNSSESRAAAAAPAAAVQSAPEVKPKDQQMSEQQQKEQERIREQQRRRMEAQSSKIDMNFQSDLLASFESNYHLNSTL